MSGFVLDCSVAASWCFTDETDDYSRSILESLSTQRAAVPPVWPLEIANVMLTAERRGRIGAAAARRFLDLVFSLPIDRNIGSSPAVDATLFHLGLQYRLSSYDASYLELALRLGLPLATRDEKLHAACERAGIAIAGK
jgi:predicted nucleic acid-binding protein